MSRGFGSPASFVIDDLVTTGVTEIYIPSVKEVVSASVTNRRRVVRIKEDAKPLEFEIRGWWIDDSVNSKYWRDFHALLQNQSQVPFDLGDGTEFRMIDVKDVAHQRHSGQFVGASGNKEAYTYSAKCLSYEPYARTRAVTLDIFKDFGAAAVGMNIFSGNYNYTGTGPGEPTWQWKLVVPSGCTVTSVIVQNGTTGETCTVSGLAITNGTYYLLIDACGGNNSGNTPNNNSYALLATTSNGFGVTLTGTGDVDWTGNPPTMKQSIAVPPTVTANSITATVVVAGAPATSIILSLVCPSRWIR